MHTLKLRLKTMPDDRQKIEARFRAIAHIHNVMVKHARKLINRIRQDHKYQGMLNEYCQIIKKNPSELSQEDKDSKKLLSEQMDIYRKSIGLDENGFYSYIKVCGKQFNKMLASQQIQKEASRVWRGVEKVLFSDGKSVRFKPAISFHTIGGKK